MQLLSPMGAVVDAAPEAVERLMAHGFRAVSQPQTVQAETKAEPKAEPKPKPKKKAAKKG